MKPASSRQRALGLLVMAWVAQAPVVQAQPEGRVPVAVPEGQGDGATSSEVSLQLLEFLGEFTTDDGEWVDPQWLMEGDPAGSRTVMGAPGRGEDGDDDEARPDNCRDARCE